MDLFKKAQQTQIGHGGLSCPCCNAYARTNNSKVNKKINRIARVKVKQDTRKLLAIA